MKITMKLEIFEIIGVYLLYNIRTRFHIVLYTFSIYKHNIHNMTAVCYKHLIALRFVFDHTLQQV